jgi:type I restriction enzyme S subunit
MQKNKNRAGYKKTKIGWIPEEWSSTQLVEACEFSQGVQVDLSEHATVPKHGYSPFLRIENYTQNSDDLRYVEDRFPQKKHVESNDTVLVRYGATAGFAGRGRCGILANNLFRVIPDEQKLTKEYLYIKLTEPRAFRYFQALMFGGAMPALSFGMVGTLQLALPSLPEQEAIAEVLECWDKAIRGYERKIEKKRNIKKGLMQRLLSGKLRLPGFDGEWKEARLGKVVAINKGQQLSRVDQTESGDYPVLNGGVQPLGYTDNWNTEANTITISEGGNSCGFVSFNRARFWCGGHCYAVEENASLVDKAFLYQLLKHKEVSIMRLRVGSGLPNIQKKTLERFLLLLPAPAEQQAIAAVLSSADAEIAALERKLAVLRDQKRFLLNNMVTGTIRLPQFVSSGAADVTTGDTE